jgi:hypothetical protein
MIIEKPSVGAASLQSILASRGKALVSEKELAALTELQANFDSLQMTIEWFSEEAARSRRQERMKRMLGDP